MINGLSHNAYLFSNMIYQWSKCLIFTVMIFFGLALNGGYSIGFVLGLTLLYLLTAVGVTNLALMFTTFFTDRDLCLGVGTILYIVVSLFYLAALAENSGIWYGLSLLFPQNGLALDVTVGQGGTILVSLFVIFVCVFFDLVFYGFLYYYLDQVLPDETGLKKKWDFIFSDAKKDSEDKAKDAKDEGERLVVKDEEDDSGSAFHYEPFPNEQKLAKSVLLKKVSKSYDEQKAVDELSLSLYEKQIICLLGHNGAGKTTTINILTGLTNSDSGDIYYHGKLIKNNNEGSRKEVGLCC
jgi:ATP-binding cassette subfamily A (ABC1) protein 3